MAKLCPKDYLKKVRRRKPKKEPKKTDKES